jgi:uncharacterized protein involved in response to NO
VNRTLPIEPPRAGNLWQAFSAAPHRMMFFAGALQVVAIIAWWLAALLARAGAVAFPATTVPETWAHGFLAVFGLFPFFVFGFLLTVYPRWMAGEPVAAGRYVPLFFLLAGGMLLFYIGLFSARAVAGAGVLVYLAGWVYGLSILLGVYRRAHHKGNHELALNTAMSAGAAGVALYAVALLAEAPLAYAAARAVGLWLFLGLTLFSVAHRMIPFFSQAVLANYPVVRAPRSLPLAAACLAGHAALEIAGRPQWLFLVDLPLAVVALQHTVKWNFRRSFEVRLLAMLHLAFAWFGLAMALYVVYSIAQLAGAAWVSERAPLHAYAIGFVTGMVMAMVSRVTLGHSGRQLWADNLTWYCFLGINVTALVRMAAEFVPAEHWTAANILAALCWLLFLVPWALHYAPIYLRPRPDGRPG